MQQGSEELARVVYWYIIGNYKWVGVHCVSRCEPMQKIDWTQTAYCRDCGWKDELEQTEKRQAPDRDDGTTDLLCPECGHFIGSYGGVPDGSI